MVSFDIDQLDIVEYSRNRNASKPAGHGLLPGPAGAAVE